ncbi:MAG: M48 family metalloprotease [Gammaproteobacteria bacterium]|nr:M48 family metalloprotease [Gammaproteobacteria bacterium]
MNQIKYSLTLLVLFSLTSLARADDLPDLGEHSKTILTSKMEKQLGTEFMKNVRLSVPILTDPIINDYIETLGNKLASHTRDKNRKFHFFVVRDPMVNAFAGPNANIGINSGTIAAVNSESELAAVMAHEIAHVTQHHIELSIENGKNAQIMATAGMIASAILGASSNSKSLSSAANGAAMASMGGSAQHMINFTRKHEIEADNIGMKILYASGLDPRAIPKVFERLQRYRFDYPNETPQFLLTHPITSDRIAEAKNRIAQYQTNSIKNQTTSNTFSLIHARTQAFNFDNSLNAINFFRTKLKNAEQKDKMALRYGYALALYENLQLTEAINIITNLQKEFPHEVLFQMLAAELSAANKQTGSAIKLLNTALTTHKNYYPLIIQYAQTLIDAKLYQQAYDFIGSKIRQRQNDPDLYLLLSQAYAKNGQITGAYQAKAKAYEIYGYNRQAAILLQQALKTPKLSTTDKTIINARIEQLKEIEKNL